MHGLLEQLEPTLGAQEEGYRLHFFRTDKSQATGSVLIALAFFVVVFVFELNFLDRAQIAPVATIRVLFFGLSIGMLAVARGIERPAVLDRLAFIWTVGFAAQFVA